MCSFSLLCSDRLSRRVRRDRNTDDDHESASHGANGDTATQQSSERGDSTGRDDSASATAERETGETVDGSKRELRPAVTRHDPDEEAETAADVLTPTGPLEPQEIDPENAAFVLLGVAIITGLLIAAVAGI